MIDWVAPAPLMVIGLVMATCSWYVPAWSLMVAPALATPTAKLMV